MSSECSIGSFQKMDGAQREADPRHQEVLICELQQDVRGLSTAGGMIRQRKDGFGTATRICWMRLRGGQLQTDRIPCELPHAGPTRSGVRIQGVVPKDVGTDESRHKCTPSGVLVSAISAPFGVRVPVAT